MRRVALVLLLAGCRGYAVDLDFVSREPLTLRSLRLETSTATLDFPSDGGLVALPASLRLLVDAPAFRLTTTGIDLSGAVHSQLTELTLAQPVTRVSVDVTAAVVCPAPAATAEQLVVFDEGARGRVVFGYDASRLSQPDDASQACTGSRLIRYQSRGRYDGLGLSASAGSRPRRIELRWAASASSGWLVGVATAQTTSWLPTPEVCATDTSRCLQSVEPEWRALSIEVPESLGPTDRLVFQQDSDGASPVLRVDDVRVVSW